MFENFVAFADASAQKAAPTTPSGDGGLASSGTLTMLIWIIALGAIFYFMLIYPQKKRTKSFNQMMSNLKRGDTIITIGGIVGKVTDIKKSTIKIRTAGNDLEITKRSVSSIVKGEAVSNDNNGKSKNDSKSDLIK